jgi:hypothetical protein
VNIVRPSTGFEIRLEPRAEAALDCVERAYPRIREIWFGITQRMKMTAHREGTKLPSGSMVIEFPSDPTYGIPKVAAIFTALGGTLTVERILICV